jgi:hypothetical protein
VDVTFDASAFSGGLLVTTDGLRRAARTVVTRQTRAAEKALEGATRTGTRGALWRAWASEIYPKSGLANAPAGEIYLNGGARTRGAMVANAYGARIRGLRGQMLAIPFPYWRERFAERGRYARALSPMLFVARSGLKLRLLPRRGKPSLLIVDWRAAGRTGLAAREVTPVFLLLPESILEGRFSVEGELAPFQQRLPLDFTNEMVSVIAREFGRAF